MNAPIPEPREQIEFLHRLQRLLTEGDFTATYKFALLIALAELAVERGSDDGGDLPLNVSWIAEKFAELYWPQSAPYTAGVVGTTPDILSQIYGDRGAVVVRLLVDFRSASNAATIAAARKHVNWVNLLRDIGRVVRDQPIRYLQNVGRQTVHFLYEIGHERGWIRLLPGTAFCLRRFQGFVLLWARSGWLQHVRENPRNRNIVGEARDLEGFMFGKQRANLNSARAFLASLQSKCCFYCNKALVHVGEVDHFIPWTLYPRDLAHNFVLSHPDCNRNKSDMLAARSHLERWRTRNVKYHAEIHDALAEIGFISDPDCTLVVARWAYSQGIEIHANAWVNRDLTEPITEAYLNALA